ncbi:hypothetical protein MKW35_17205, partial [Aestuariibaculum sp. L182]|nr:hypothetical protein [Aestuariibaculum lutulentum]
DVRTSHEIVRRQITIMVEDVIRTAQTNIEALQPQCVDDIHNAGRMLIGFSGAMRDKEKLLKSFLYKNLYFHESVIRIRKSADQIVR